MRKEIVVAILLGFAIGLFVIFGIITAQTALKQHQQALNQNTAGETSSPQGDHSLPTPKPSHTLSITDPQNFIVVSSSDITIHGKTSPLSSVAITSEKDDSIVEANQSGLFSLKISLVSGENEIIVVSVSPNLERAETTLTLVYTTAQL